jgi:predicted short-subunit dehydrogenase-like oxidoreductase (DUF2520 family)
MKIVIIGGGAVAEGLAREIGAVAEAGGALELTQQWTRRTHSPEELAEADLYILAVSDRAVTEVSAELPFAPGAVVAHTAGCVPMGDISPRITHRAVLYPLQSFTRGRRIADFRRTPFFVEGATPHALQIVRETAQALSDNVVEMNSELRAHLHLVGAVANNFSNAMFSLAEELAADADIPFDYIKPIIAETVAKAMAMPSPRLAQTGAARRGDEATLHKHTGILAAKHPEYIPLYKEISDMIWKTSKKN